MSSKPDEVFSCHVKYLPLCVSKKDVAKIFSSYDDLVQIYICAKNMNQDYTFGFVRFRTLQSANHAVKYVTGKIVNGHKLVVSHAKPSVVTNSVSSELLTINFRKQLQKEFDSKDEEIDKVLEDIASKKALNMQHLMPESAFSLELTDILTETMNYKYWNEFFSNQKEISRKLRMIPAETPNNTSSR